MRTLTLAALLGITMLAGGANALEIRSFKSAEDEARFRELVAVLRCLVCQNQSLADSDADLAKDLRREVHEMIDAGRTDDEITDFMVERYGDFVLYKPPFKASTAALWIAPFAAVPVALGVLALTIRARRRQAGSAPSESERKATRDAAEDILRKRRGDDQSGDDA